MARMKWFRFYSEALHDPKVLRLPVKMRWRWVELLAIASEQDERRGELPPAEDIALILRTSVKDVSDSLLQLSESGLIDITTDGVRPHNWEKWQPGYDNAAERMANKRRTSSEHVQNNVRTSSEHVRARSDQIRTEEEQKRAEAEEDAREQPQPPPLTEYARHTWGRLLSPYELEYIHGMEGDYERDCIEHAFRESAELNKRTIRYVEAICRNHKEKGDCFAGRTDNGEQRRVSNGGVTEIISAEAELARYGPRPIFVLDPGGVGESDVAPAPPSHPERLEV